MTDDPFVAHRSLLFTVAYEVLGSAADAEDVVQETWLRWATLDDAARADVRDPRAYLVRIVTRQALNRLRTLARRREDYVGEWLPEPLLVAGDVADDVELAESVSFAMLTVLETLEPVERAVFVLREVFDTPYEEIAQAVDRSPAAVRQIAHRARSRVAERRPKRSVSRTEQDAVVARFIAAVRGGDMAELLEVLAPEVVAVADGGGVVSALPRPLRGAEKVASFFAMFRDAALDFTTEPARVNGDPAVRLELEGELNTVMSLVIEGGRISAIYAVRNPHKLARVDRETVISR
jgi:RNA polymerase sigma-70 factor (TIGR02957 family)